MRLMMTWEMLKYYYEKYHDEHEDSNNCIREKEGIFQSDIINLSSVCENSKGHHDYDRHEEDQIK